MSLSYKIFDDEIVVISLSDRLDASNADVLKKVFEGEISGFGKFVFDLSELEYLDSAGLGGLVYCLKISDSKKGVLKISSLNTKPKLVFEITRADKVFDIYDNLGDALKSFKTV